MDRILQSLLPGNWALHHEKAQAQGMGLWKLVVNGGTFSEAPFSLAIGPCFPSKPVPQPPECTQ